MIFVVISNLSCKQIGTEKNMVDDKEKIYTKEDILNDLDDAEQHNPYKSFVHIGNSLEYPIASKMSLFANETSWAIVFEEAIYNKTGPNVSIRLTYFGNCILNPRYVGKDKRFYSNTDYIGLWLDSYLYELTDGYNLISKKIDSVLLRGENVKIERDIDKYDKMEIPIFSFNNPDKQVDWIAFARYTASIDPELFSAKDEELRKHLPKDLPKIMVINEWHHKDYGKPFNLAKYGSAPSSYETFQQIADVLVSKDTTKYKPTLKANTHWSNWPNAGKE